MILICCKTLKNNLDNWDRAYEISKNINFVTWPRKKIESSIKEEAKIIRDDVKKKLNKVINKILICDSDEAKQDIQDMYNVLDKLKYVILEFQEDFQKEKEKETLLILMI